MNFGGKTVPVTGGASRGIGLGIARGFAGAGANFVPLADDEAVLPAARERGGAGFVADIADEDAVAARRCMDERLSKNG